MLVSVLRHRGDLLDIHLSEIGLEQILGHHAQQAQDQSDDQAPAGLHAAGVLPRGGYGLGLHLPILLSVPEPLMGARVVWGRAEG